MSSGGFSGPSSRRISNCRKWTSRRRASAIRRSSGADARPAAAGYQTDLTRVISFMIGKEQAQDHILRLASPEAHHPLSHHQDNPDLIAHMSKINRYHAELFAKYLAKLRATETATAICSIT